MKKIDTPLTVEGKGQKNTQSRRGKSFGYQVLGFGAGGSGAPGIVANGGTLTYDGDDGINTFTSTGTLEVVQLGKNGDNQVEYVVVAGGGTGTNGGGQGGGGAGGYRANGTYNMTVAVTSYPVTVGTGGASSNASGTNSSFNSIAATGGGGGGGNPGGSGGAPSGSGNAGGYSPVEGYNGGPNPGHGPYNASGGGGGSAGTGGGGGGYAAGGGGPGTVNDILGTPYTFAAGGTGESNNPSGWGPIGPSIQTVYGNGAPSSRGGQPEAADGVVIVRYRSLSTP